ncbi:MAG: glycosyltransferase family 39 protein [Candidatus Moranbacteria bacterium]|nr:glycosyltransferase family 39 protein [Candidatus Moranbacteria bacterium]MDD3965147.1 glycosyltransferase family 39 protein [Candidatus Moranbacteria bacterium]
MSLFRKYSSHQIATGFLLFGILVLAFSVRIYHIESIPAGIYPDEAANGVDALHALETGVYQLFYTANYGREGLFINLQALSISLFGNTILGLKLWSIIFGTLSVLGIYLLGKELFHRRIAGLFASFMLATSYWAINFSRIGFRAIMTTFLLTFSFYYFFRGLRTRKFRDFFISGILFGTGMHTYIAFRVAPLILLLLLPALILSYERFFARYYKHALLFILGAFISALPMFYHFFVSHPENFESRSDEISIFSPKINHGSISQTLARTFSLSLIKYNFFGDQNWRHNYPPYPILSPFVGTFFLAGFLFVLWQTGALLIRRIRYHNRDTRLVLYFFLLGSFFTMLLPEFLSGEGLPHALRSIGTQMPVFLIATLPALWIFHQALRSRTGSRIALLFVLFIALSGSMAFDLTKYFVFFAKSPNAGGSFNENYTNMGRYLLTLSPETKKYVLFSDEGNNDRFRLPVFAHPVYYLTYGRVANMEIIGENTLIQSPAIFLMVNYNEEIAKKIFERVPNTRIERIDMNGPDRTGGDFNVIFLSEN